MDYSTEPQVVHVTKVLSRIQDDCDKLGRSMPRIVAVTKGHPKHIIEIALAAGLHEIGENYVQEALSKKSSLLKVEARHFIGRLQRNKVKTALSLFNWIQTVTSLKLLHKIGRVSNLYQQQFFFMLQVNFTGEPQKNGISPKEVIPLLEEYERIKHDYPFLAFKGLMTIGKQNDPHTTRQAFRECVKLGDRIKNMFSYSHLELSFGMSQDYRIALEEGSTMLRLGSIFFGPRIP